MSREGLIDKFLARGIAVESFVYGQQQVSVYKGKYQQYQVAAKVLLVSSQEKFAQGEKEFQTMTRLNHPAILRIYHYFPESLNDKQYQVFVTEWCPKDLAKDVDDRKKNNFPWREDELWVVILKLIEGFAYMQKSGFAHRDIKPANIFYELRQEVKIGDLGSTTANPAEWYDIVGTPQYLSPLLRTAMIQRTPCYHNAYKSDVFSLGVTIFELASLQVATFRGISLSQEAINQLVDSLQYSDNLKGLIKTMLAVEEKDRPDFIQLDQWTKPAPHDPLPAIPVVQAPVDLTSPDNEKTMVRKLTGPSGKQSNGLEATLFRVKLSDSQPVEEVKLPVPKVERPNPQCLHCFRDVDVDLPNSKFEVVQLECNPSEHMFCSRSCFAAWGYQQPKVSVECPTCHSPIAIEVFQSYNFDLETDDEDPIPPQRSLPEIVEEPPNIPPGRTSITPLLSEPLMNQPSTGGTADLPNKQEDSLSSKFCKALTGFCNPGQSESGTPS